MSKHIDLADFTQCRFIEEYLRYVDLLDFIKNGHIIKARFEKQLDANGKLFYKYYVYAHTNTTTKQKDAIWDYLNNEEARYRTRLANMLNAINIQKSKIVL